MQSQKLAIITTVTALLLVISAVSTITPESVSAYQKNQAASQANACGNEFIPINIGCQNTDSQIQGDENAVALTAQQTFPEVKLVQEKPSHPPKTPPPPPPPEPQTAMLNVIKEVICSPDLTENGRCPSPEQFEFTVSSENQNPISFQGSATGTPVTLEPGEYEVTEMGPNLPAPIITLDPVFSADCSGQIEAGQELTCTATNEFMSPSPEPQTCVECFTTFLTTDEQAELIATIAEYTGPDRIVSLEDLCDTSDGDGIFSEASITTIESLLGPGVGTVVGMNLDQDRIDQIIECLHRVFPDLSPF